MSEQLIRLHGSWRYNQTAEGIEIGSVLHRIRFRLSGPTRRLKQLLDTLIDGVPVDRVTENLTAVSGLSADSVERVLTVLRERQALDVSTQRRNQEWSDLLYDRQIRYLDSFARGEENGLSFHRRLRERKVVLVGVGGYGTWLALHCVRLGIRNIVAIDGDRVELSNLPRQILYSRGDVGAYKVEAAKRALLQVDENVRFEDHVAWIHSPEDLMPHLKGADLIFNAFGYTHISSPVNETVVEAALMAGVPCLTYHGSWVGPLTIPSKTACMWCLTADPTLTALAKASMPLGAGGCFGPAFGPRMAMSSSLAAWEAARFLSGIDQPPTLDGMIVLDLYHYQRHQFVPLARNPSCPHCATRAAGSDGRG